jgi:hypothetical protein
LANRTTLSVAAGELDFGSLGNRILSASTSYYVYPYINVADGSVGMTNSTTPATTGNQQLAMQANYDGRIPIGVIVITTPSVGIGTITGSQNDTCPEQTEIVEVIKTADVSAAIAAGTLTAFAIDPAQVGTGLLFASQCVAVSTVTAGDYIRGKCFGSGADIYRKVIASSSTSCAAWRVVDGHLCSPCEAVWHDDRWQTASRVSSAVDTTVSRKIQLTVESDHYDESNYYLVSGTELLIHNAVPISRNSAC